MEAGGGFAKLIGLRPVLGIVDHGQIAGRELQGIIQRFRFRARLPVRDDDQVHVAGEGKLRRRLDGSGVHLLQHDLDVELCRRVIELGQRLR